MAPKNKRCWGSHVTDFRIELAKYVYVPGEAVHGTLHLSTDAPVECRGLHIRLEHKSEIHWHSGEGDKRKDYHAEQVRPQPRAAQLAALVLRSPALDLTMPPSTQRYGLEQRTVWGTVFKTVPVLNAGANCVWGSIWAPTEGHIVMPLRGDKGSLVALRVLDFDFGQRDDVLGECLVDVDALLAAPGQLATLPLFRKGLVHAYGPQMVSGQPSVVTLCAFPEPPQEGVPGDFACQGMRRVRICLVSASNLRSADVFGSNDVYCQLWEVAGTTEQGRPLPEPPARVKMPQALDLCVPALWIWRPACAC
jgi:hypothetical protein